MNFAVVRQKFAFTLVELLGVIAIIALLANIALMSVQGTLGASQEGAIKREVQVLNSAYQNFIAAGGDMRLAFGDPNLNSAGQDLTSDDSAASAGGRAEKKKLAPIALEILMKPWNTNAYGVVGPFLPETSRNIWLNGGFLSKDVLGAPHFIGFELDRGFSYLGGEPTPAPLP
jgi:prepilin-type N-terminal cleavage/methylation domain-containing protein